MNTHSPVIARISGSGLPLPGNDIDTDRIIPARFLRSITFAGLGEQVFRDERFDDSGAVKQHPFNDKSYAGAEILIVNSNFGCGSSREHAPQAIARYGIAAIIGESFAEIFAGNCTSLGLPAVTMDHAAVVELQQRVVKDPASLLTIDIDALTLSYDDRQIPLQMNPSARAALLDGTWDTLDVLLGNVPAIEAVNARLPSCSTRR